MDFDYKNTNETIEYRHIRYKEIPKIAFHLHDGFEIYFLISGDVNYLIENKIYDVKYGNLIITNNEELHKVCVLSNKTYERITLFFNPKVVASINTDAFDLLNCFIHRVKGQQNKLILNKNQIDETLLLFYKFEALNNNPAKENDALKLAYLIEILVHVNKLFDNCEKKDSSLNIPNKLSQILNYIDNNLEQELTLDFLSNYFYIDKYYLCKLFKSSFNSSVYEYIICKRISKAKKLIVDGYNLTETCNSCGFKDYSSFFRMFRKHIGISPSEYKKLKNTT